jgi:hypothetical protein
MITIGPVGDQGTISAPLETTFALYRQCAIWNPGGITNPLLLTTNGVFDIASADPTKLSVATANIPVSWVFDENDFIKNKEHNIMDKFIIPIFDKAKSLCKYIEGNDDALMRRMQDNAKLVDVNYETVNMIPRKKPIIYRDRMEVIIGFDKIFKATQEDELQWYIQDRIDLIRYVPKPVPIGYGFFTKEGDKMKLIRRPNRYFKVGPRTVVRLDQTTLDLSNNAARRQALYVYLAAMALYMFIEGTDKIDINDKCFRSANSDNHWTIHDYTAIVCLLLSGLVGFGDTPNAKTWSSLDIQTTLDHIFGFGYSIANRLLWESTPENFCRYQTFCMFLGFAMSRVKPILMNYQLVKYINQDRMVTERFMRVNHGHFESVGSMSGMMLPMPRNDLRWRGTNMFPFPVLMNTEAFENERMVLEKANVYDFLRSIQGKSFQQVEVTKGEIPPNTIDLKSMDQKLFSFKTANDARIVEESYEMRDTIKYKFPRWGIVINSMPDSLKRFLFMVGLFTNGDRLMKDGYITEVSMQIFSPVEVKYFRTKTLDTAIVKEGSETQTDVSKDIIQQPKPLAGATGPANIKRENTKAEVEQPPPVETVPEKTHSDQLTGDTSNVPVKNESEPENNK